MTSATPTCPPYERSHPDCAATWRPSSRADPALRLRCRRRRRQPHQAAEGRDVVTPNPTCSHTDTAHLRTVFDQRCRAVECAARTASASASPTSTAEPGSDRRIGQLGGPRSPAHKIGPGPASRNMRQNQVSWPPMGRSRCPLTSATQKMLTNPYYTVRSASGERPMTGCTNRWSLSRSGTASRPRVRSALHSPDDVDTPRGDRGDFQDALSMAAYKFRGCDANEILGACPARGYTINGGSELPPGRERRTRANRCRGRRRRGPR